MIKQENIRFRLEENHFGKLLGLISDQIEAGFAVCRMPITPALTNPYGFAQGGSLVSFADATMALALVYLDEAVTTNDIQYHFTEGIRLGAVARCEARVVKEGRKLVTLEARVYAQAGTEVRLIGLSTATYYRLGRPMLPEER